MEGLLQLLWLIAWQAAVLAALVFLVSRISKRAPAAWRHALWVIVLVKLFVPPLAQIPAQWAFRQADAPVPAVTVVAPPAAAPTVSTVTLPSAQAAVPGPAQDAPAAAPSRVGTPVDWRVPLAAVWLAGFAAMSLMPMRGYRRLSKLVSSSRPASGEWTAMLARAAGPLGVHRLAEIRFSDSVPTPVLVGFLRPVILIPSGIEETCSGSDLFAILSHELAHVRRRDAAVAWFQQIAQALFFFHPAVWLAGRGRFSRRSICGRGQTLCPGYPY